MTSDICQHWEEFTFFQVFKIVLRLNYVSLHICSCEIRDCYFYVQWYHHFPHMSHSWRNPIEIIFSQLSFKKSVTSISPCFSLCHLSTFLLSILSLSSYHLHCMYTHMKHVHVCEATHAYFLIMLLTSDEVLSLGQLPSFIFHLLCS